jgi:hypothetical protein
MFFIIRDFSSRIYLIYFNRKEFRHRLDINIPCSKFSYKIDDPARIPELIIKLEFLLIRLEEHLLRLKEYLLKLNLENDNNDNKIIN